MRSFGRPRVLICDDEEGVRNVCARGLTQAGYEAVAVASGDQAVRAAKRETFDVFVLDVRINEQDGAIVLSKLRELDPDTPCVVISGWADFDDAIRLLRHGATEFIKKPFDLTQIVMAVDRVLASTHLKVDSALLAATQTIFSSLDAKEIVARVLGTVRSLLQAESTAIFLADPPRTYRLLPGEKHVRTDEGVDLSTGALARLTEKRDPVLLVRDTPGDAEPLEQLAPGAQSAVVQRLAVSDRVLGLLVGARPAGHRVFGDSDMRRAVLVAGHVALALDNARLHSTVSETASKLETALDRLVVAERVATMGRLASGIGHEVSNPACAVLAHLELAGEQLLAGQVGDVRDALKRASAGARAILDVVQALRPLAGSSPRTELVDLRQVLESALMLASYELRGKARVVVDLPPKLPTFVGHQAKLGQVFLNLLLNAATAIPGGAASENEVRVSLKATSNEAIVSVADTGKGVPREMVNKLFEPSVTTKTSGSGHGMGLAICKWIMEEMGGKIRCLPDIPRGAVFEVTLPLRTSSAALATSP